MTDPVARINALTTNARNTWFVLLAALIFVGVTLMQVTPVDFYGVNRATNLPMVNISVPTRLFFIGGPILIAAVYGYFHLYLIRLWDALSVAPARIDGTRLGDAVSPWLVVDAALFLRRWLRQDYCAEKRTMEFPSMVLNILLAWVAGIAILGWLWWTSMTARAITLTIWPTLALGISVFVGLASLSLCLLRMRTSDLSAEIATWSRPVKIALLLIFPAAVWFSYERTEGNRWLVPVNLASEQIVARPQGWRDPAVLRAEARAAWCAKKSIADCEMMHPAHEKDFVEEWDRARDVAILDLTKPGLNPMRFEKLSAAVARAMNTSNLSSANLTDPEQSGTFRKFVNRRARNSLDFRNAELNGAFLTGANLVGARMQGAGARGAVLERAGMQFANLGGQADFAGSILSGARLAWVQGDSVVLTRAQMGNADLRWSQMNGAIFINAVLRGADLSHAILRKAYFELADLTMSKLTETSLDGAILRKARLRHSDFTQSSMRQADLSQSRGEGTKFYRADLSWAIFRRAQLPRADLGRSNLSGANFRWSNFKAADFSLSLIDGEKTMSMDDFRGANFSHSVNAGGAIRKANLKSVRLGMQSDWRNAFFDGSVSISPPFRRRMGMPCQWIVETLDEKAFFAHWRGWLKQNNEISDFVWQQLVPAKHHDVVPHDWGDCRWKTAPFAHHSGGR